VFLLVIFVPWLCLAAMLAVNGREMLDTVRYNHPKLLVNVFSDKRPKSIFSILSPITILAGVTIFDINQNLIVSWGEFIASRGAIESVGDKNLKVVWERYQKIKRVFIFYNIFLFVAIMGYIIFLVLNYEV